MSAHEIFGRIDKDGNGNVSPDELAVHLLGLGVDEDQVSALFLQLDLNSDGKITLEEFKAGYAAYCATASNQERDSASAITVGQPCCIPKTEEGHAVIEQESAPGESIVLEEAIDENYEPTEDGAARQAILC